MEEKTNEQEIDHFSNSILTWQAVSFLKFIRTKGWYATLISLLFILILIAIYLGSPTFAIAIIVFAMIYMHFTSEEPKIINVSISDLGIKHDNKIYNFTDIKTYWIEYDPPAFQCLHLVMKEKMKHEVSIHFHGLNPSDIRLVLSQFLPEWTERKKTFSEHMINFLGL